MADITPPYDFPPRPDSAGEEIEQVLNLIRMYLREHPYWLPIILKVLQEWEH